MSSWGDVQYTHGGEVSIAHVVGGEAPPTVLFIGGFVGHLEIGTAFPAAQRFWERMCSFARVVAFDKRCTGLSDRSADYTVEGVVDDCLAVLDSLGLERVAVFGISEGSSAATMLAATHPERVSAVIEFGAYARIPEAPDNPHGVPVELVRSTWERMVENWGHPGSIDWWAPSLSHDPEARDWWARLLRSGTSPGTVRTMARMYEELDVRPLLSAVQAPTLVLYRTGDRVVPPGLSRAVAEGIPGAQVVELPGSDHLYLAGDQDELLEPIEEFLTGRPAVVRSDRVLATVLFSDLVGSTERAAELGDRQWSELLAQHERSAARAIQRFDGRLIKTMGDGLLATFDGPARGVRTAMAIRNSMSSLGLEARAGVHTGECELVGGDVAGMAVHIAARLESLASPGEVLVSSTVKDLVVGSGLSFSPRGPHQLKGVPGEWQVFEAIAD